MSRGGRCFIYIYIYFFLLKSPCGGGGGGGEGGGGDKEKNAVSPFVEASGKQISVLLSASVEKFGVSRMQIFLFIKKNKVSI